jgi:endonuclease-3
MKPPNIDWPTELKPLLKKYKDFKHPLEAHNTYQLLVMVVLSAQSTDVLINKIAPKFFEVFPNMKKLSSTKPELLYPYLSGVRNFANKAKWLVNIASQLKEDKNIPLTLDELVELPGIGRKSANVIKREAGASAEGIIVDLHVQRVAPRLGITNTTDPKKIEKDLMEIFPEKDWDIGMALSFHGRDTCKPKPKCEICIVNKVCAYYNGWE